MTDVPNRPVTIVTWHYVRDGAPGELHARTVAEFDSQLDHIAGNFTPVTLDQIRDHLRHGKTSLPENACLLTFDDGYRDHHDTVFPRLAARGWQGVFFAPTRSAGDRQVLDVNRIQFAIAAVGIDQVVRETRAEIDNARDEFDLPDSGTLYDTLAVAGLHNPPEAMFVKRALQTALPEALRTRICQALFERHVSADEADFAAMLYAGSDELREMHDGGMAIGGHGWRHQRMSELAPGDRRTELERSRAFLESLGIDTTDGWSFCYPYGAHDTDTVRAARDAGCDLAFTLEPRIADLAVDDPCALPRLDTNDLPR
ncbi:MAG: polysaccharide deacetylase family protein [Alphaproteobacteria bacterium]|nr:polysaccharide deacetylase family protein [Alphaproteobacteria bacterium]